MTPRLQKLTLLAHITFSVGWFGAVVPYLALAIAALTSHDGQMVRAACLSMKFIGWFVIVPFSLAAMLSGLVQSLGTRSGLFRHWWVLAKFVLAVFATVILFQHMTEVSRLSLMAKQTMLSTADLRPELIHSAGGLLVLLAAMTLSVFKPWGMTSYGRRRTTQADTVSRPRGDNVLVHEPVFASRKPRWARIVGFHAIGIPALVAVLHVLVFHVTGLHHH